MTEMCIGRKEQRRKWLLLLMAILGLMFVWYGNYIELAKCTIPYSDFFQWTTKYGEKLIANTIEFKDYFESDSGEHIQPLGIYLNCKVLKITDFDYSKLVTIGAVVRCIIAGYLSLYFFFRMGKNSTASVWIVLCSTVLAFTLLNFNQWEITTEPFSLGNTVRLLAYFSSFMFADVWIRKIKIRCSQKNIIYGGLLGVGLSCVTLSVSGGYFVGHILSIACVFLYEFAENIKDVRQYIFPLISWGTATFAGCIVYLLLVYVGERHATIALSVDILDVLLGVILFWGAAFLPTGIFENAYGLLPHAIVGTIAIIAMTILTCRYIKNRSDRDDLFPVYCIVYANIIAVIIAVARTSTFSYVTMTSSRYVIESTIGMVGVTWLLGREITARTELKKSVYSVVGMVAMIMLLTLSAFYEVGRAPYIRRYYDDIETQLLNYQDCTDEMLMTISATSPEKARKCLEFLESEHLSIFK